MNDLTQKLLINHPETPLKTNEMQIFQHFLKKGLQDSHKMDEFKETVYSKVYKRHHVFEIPGRGVSLSWCPNSSKLTCGDRLNYVRTFDVATKEDISVGNWRGTNQLYGLAWNPDEITIL